MQSKHTHTQPLTYLYRYQMFEACLLEVKQMFHWHCCCTYQHYSTTKTTVVPLEKVRIDQIDTPPPPYLRHLYWIQEKSDHWGLFFVLLGLFLYWIWLENLLTQLGPPLMWNQFQQRTKSPLPRLQTVPNRGIAERRRRPRPARVFFTTVRRRVTQERAQRRIPQSQHSARRVSTWGEDCTVWRWSGAEETQPKPTTWYTHTHMGAVYTDTTHWFQIQKWIWYENNCFLRTPIKNRVFSRQTDK